MVVDPTHGTPESYMNKTARSRVKGVAHGTKQVRSAFSGKSKPVKMF